MLGATAKPSAEASVVRTPKGNALSTSLRIPWLSQESALVGCYLYKHVRTAVARLRQAEQESPPSQTSPSECAKQQAAQASEGGADLPPAETAEADERRAQQ